MTQAGHWRKDKCDVYVGRGSPWGNPFVARGMAARSKYSVTEVDDPLDAYETHVRDDEYLMSQLHTLRGKTLGCFCVRAGTAQPKRGHERCHAQVLVRLVAEDAEPL